MVAGARSYAAPMFAAGRSRYAARGYGLTTVGGAVSVWHQRRREIKIWRIGG